MWSIVAGHVDEIVPLLGGAAFHRAARGADGWSPDLADKVMLDHETVKRSADAVVVNVINDWSNADEWCASYVLAGKVRALCTPWRMGARVPLEQHIFKVGSHSCAARYREPRNHAASKRYAQLPLREGVTQGTSSRAITRDGTRSCPIPPLDYARIARDPAFRVAHRRRPVAVNYDACSRI